MVLRRKLRRVMENNLDQDAQAARLLRRLRAARVLTARGPVAGRAAAITTIALKETTRNLHETRHPPFQAAQGRGLADEAGNADSRIPSHQCLPWPRRLRFSPRAVSLIPKARCEMGSWPALLRHLKETGVELPCQYATFRLRFRSVR